MSAAEPVGGGEAVGVASGEAEAPPKRAAKGKNARELLRAQLLEAAAAGRDVECATPGELGVREQLEALGRATVVVCEHGSTSYVALFMRPGASIVAVVPTGAPDAKEGMVLLFLPDVNAYFISQERAERDAEFSGALALAASRAGERMRMEREK